MVVGVDLDRRGAGLPAGGEAGPVQSAEEGASSRLGCSVGIMAFNEEANIGNAIKTVLDQKPGLGQVVELIVVASGCTDRTCEIVAGLAREDPRIRLIVEEQREGKASAVNRFIGTAQSAILLLVSADVLVEDESIDALFRHFDDPTVGMVGGHPIPVNDEGTFLGHAVHLLWRLHDQIARESPKLGEIVAFRNVVSSIPTDTAVDELSLQALITDSGYRLAYEPRAVVYNTGPTTLGDFLRQRRRIYAGHLEIAKKQGYAASTMSTRRVVRAVVKSESFRAPRAALWLVAAGALEGTARILGHYDVVRKRPHHVWATVTTTKRDLAGSTAVQSDPPVGEQHILVFHPLNPPHGHGGTGMRMTRSSRHRMARQIQRTLGPRAAVSEHKSGTIIAVLSGERSNAESAAHLVVHDLSADQTDGHNGSGPPKVAFGVVTFPTSGDPLVGSVPDLAS